METDNTKKHPNRTFWLVTLCSLLADLSNICEGILNYQQGHPYNKNIELCIWITCFIISTVFYRRLEKQCERATDGWGNSLNLAATLTKKLLKQKEEDGKENTNNG